MITMTKRPLLAAAGMALVLSVAVTGPVSADIQPFSFNALLPVSHAQAAESTPAVSASTSDVWVEDTIELNGDEWAGWSLYSDASTNYIIKYDFNGDALLDPFGVVLSDTYANISPVYGSDGYFFFAVQNDEGSGVNTQGCIDATGVLFTDFIYTDFVAADSHWLCAITTEQVPETTTHEYSDFDGNYYTISQVDVYYDNNLVTSLTRDEYAGSPTVTDGYLVLESRAQGGYDIYAPTGELVNHSDSYLGNDEYYIDDDGVLRHISGAQVGTPDCTLTYDDVEQPYILGSELGYDSTTVYDIYGTQVASFDFNIWQLYPFADGYAVVESYDGRGVVDENWNVVIPCEYDYLGTYDGDYTAFRYGYCYAEKDGMFGYFASDGTLSVPLEYSINDLEFEGELFSIIHQGNQYRIISAADGLLDPVYSDQESWHSSTSPVAKVANEDGLWGVVDYRGNALLDFGYEEGYFIDLAEDGSLALLEPQDYDDYSATIVRFATIWDEGGSVAEQAAAPAEPSAPAEEPAEPAAEPAEPAEAPTASGAAESSAAADSSDATPETPAASVDDAALTTVTYGGLSVSIPQAWLASEADDGTQVNYTNEEGSISLAIADGRTEESAAGVDPQTFLEELVGEITASYGDAYVEDLGEGLVDGTEAYAYGVSIPIGDDAYDTVAICVAVDGGLSLVQIGYQESALTDSDAELLTQIVDSIALASNEGAAADSADSASDEAASAVSSLKALFS